MLCQQLGLGSGDEQEAYKSKRVYASKRLRGVGWPRLVATAKRLLQEVDDYALSEAVEHVEEVGTPPITELTRKRIASVVSGVPLVNAMDEHDFIKRVWPIDRMPPVYESGHASRSTLEDNYIRHAVHNSDWDNQDILRHMGFFTCSRAQVVKFLKAVTDPLAQDSTRQEWLVHWINEHLQHDGYKLVEAGRMSGSPTFDVVQIQQGVPADASISAVLEAFNPDSIHVRWQLALERRATDPAGAITLARTLLEDVSKWILHEAGVEYDDGDELPVLYRKLSKTLKLAPDDHSEEVFKKILGSCQNIVESLGALRNKLSDAHSPGPKRARPQARHAELAVNLAGTMATFLVSTWQARQSAASA
ncbi:hypothetical protein GOB49_23645 [Sinorhizobium meliloti]|nr:hypothetical protein [Sinorhizobium meliloti]